MKITDVGAALDTQWVKVDTPKQVSQLRRELAEAQAEITRLKSEAESWEQVFDRTCEHLAEAKTEIAALKAGGK